MNKVWQIVLNAFLEKKAVGMYYMGATLCVDITKTCGVALNLDGTGFTYGTQSKCPWVRERKIYIPKEVLEYVRIIYLEYKDNQAHYDEVVKDY